MVAARQKEEGYNQSGVNLRGELNHTDFLSKQSISNIC